MTKVRKKVDAEVAAKALYDRMCDYEGIFHEAYCINKILVPWIQSQEDKMDELAASNAVQVDREDLALVLGNYTFGDHHESNWACNRLLRFLSTEGKGE